MQARTTHGCAVWPVMRQMPLLIALVLCACNAPSYPGMPISDFLQTMEEEDAALRATSTSEPASSPATRPAVAATEYQIGPSDVLDITIYGLDSLEAPTVLPARVSEAGQIVLPLVGLLSVDGQTLAQAERAIIAAYSPRYIVKPRVLVDVKQYYLTNVLVIAGQSGAHDVALRRNERNVFQSLARVQGGIGGPMQRVYVQPASDPNKLEEYDLNRPGELVRVMSRPPLAEGDIVIARAAPPPVVYVYGLTGRGRFGNSIGGNVYAIPENGMRLLQAVAAAGGPPTEFDADKVVLTRRLRDGRNALVVFKWKNLVDGKEPDVDLRPGDVIEIPHTAQTRTEEILRRAIVFQAGMTAVYDPISQFVPTRVNVGDGNNDGYSIRKLILSDVALKAVNKVTSPVLGP
jgi:protein involved in polysaccharide export with SLBB domain